MTGPVVTNAYVYWVVEENINDPSAWTWRLYRIPKCGGDPDVVDEGSLAFRGLAVLGEAVFYAASSDALMPSGLLRWIDGPSKPMGILEGTSPARSLAAGDEGLYWTTAEAVSDLLRIRIDGSGLDTVAHDVSSWLGLAVDDQHVYWGATGFVGRVPKEGGPVEQFAQLTLGGEILVDEDFVYVVDLRESDENGILQIRKDDGQVVELTSEILLPYLAQDEEAIYYRNLDTLWRHPKDGGPRQAIAHTRFFSGLAADEHALYWYDEGIVRLPLGQ